MRRLFSRKPQKTKISTSYSPGLKIFDMHRRITDTDITKFRGKKIVHELSLRSHPFLSFDLRNHFYRIQISFSYFNLFMLFNFPLFKKMLQFRRNL